MILATLGIAAPATSTLALTLNQIAIELSNPNVTKSVRNIARAALIGLGGSDLFPELSGVIERRLEELDEFDAFIDYQYEVHGNNRQISDALSEGMFGWESSWAG
jgi:hypothetical protein